MAARPIVALSCAMLSAACTSWVATKPVPNAALLLPCVDPRVPDPETASDRDVALALLEIGKAYYDCKRRQADLAKWVREQ